MEEPSRLTSGRSGSWRGVGADQGQYDPGPQSHGQAAEVQGGGEGLHSAGQPPPGPGSRAEVCGEAAGAGAGGGLGCQRQLLVLLAACCNEGVRKVSTAAAQCNELAS